MTIRVQPTIDGDPLIAAGGQPAPVSMTGTNTSQPFPRYASLPSAFFTTSSGEAAYFAGNALGLFPLSQLTTLFNWPLFTGSLSPVDNGVPVQVPLAAAWTWFRILASFAFCPGTMLAHAAVLPPTADPLELLMNVTVAPQPSEVDPPKKHELSAIGNTQAVGGGVTG
jgi:hypothetical protein